MRFEKGICIVLVVGLLTTLSLSQSTPVTPGKPVTPAASNVHTTDDPEVTRETQFGIDINSHVGLVWWIPFEFWVRSGEKQGADPEKSRQQMKALRDYTVVGVFLAKVSSLGSFDYLTPSDLQKKVFLRDSEGQDYAALSDVSGDAKNLADVIRPMLANAMGRAGENFAMLFFPAKTKAGKAIADESSKGNFSIVLKDAVGEPETIVAWRTPLTSFAKPRYCPVGKERVHADWDYCPWHGVKLGNP